MHVGRRAWIEIKDGQDNDRWREEEEWTRGDAAEIYGSCTILQKLTKMKKRIILDSDSTCYKTE